MAFGHGSNFSTAHVETVVHTFLETQGEVFALLRQSDSHDGAFRALAEFADADVALAVVHRFNGTTLGVSYLLNLVPWIILMTVLAGCPSRLGSMSA